MRIDSDPKLDYADVLIRPKRSTLKSRSVVDLTREFKFRWSPRSYQGVPIIAANMDTIGTIEMHAALNEHRMSTALHKHYTVEALANIFNTPDQSNLWYSLGISKDDLAKYYTVQVLVRKYWAERPKNGPVPSEDFLDHPIQNICIDVANGYSEHFVDFIQRFRDANPKATIMAGNVVTPEITEELILKGVDIVKIGIGPGAVCLTRQKTGVGYPQLSAVIETADAAHGLAGHICADGGCVVPGDVAKAFGAGADFVMLGGMLAGHDECGGEITQHEGDAVMEFYGMSSRTAQEKHNGGVAEYRASEGKRVLVPYRGPVGETAQNILGGLRSACTYVGATRLKEMSRRTTFILVNRQLNESLSGYNSGE